jgi:hypothetical protein
MRRLVLALAVTLVSTPLLAQEAPLGIFRCHGGGNDMSPFGILILDGAGYYQMIATSTPDFVADPSLTYNGSGDYAVAGTQVLAKTGPLHDLFSATGSVLGAGQRATIGFANSSGTLFTCLPTV